MWNPRAKVLLHAFIMPAVAHRAFLSPELSACRSSSEGIRVETSATPRYETYDDRNTVSRSLFFHLFTSQGRSGFDQRYSVYRQSRSGNPCLSLCIPNVLDSNSLFLFLFFSLPQEAVVRAARVAKTADVVAAL